MRVPGLARHEVVCLLLLSVLVAVPAQGAGFGIFEQGTKATGMSNAFTAQADDPSAMFYNVGGLAFQNERDFMAGVTIIFLGDSDFSGLAPFPGPTSSGSQQDQLRTPIHFYWVEPITDKLTFGLGLMTPFGLVTEWDNPEQWSGRFISTKADLTAIDLNPNIGWQITDKLGIGGGIVVRASSVELSKNLGIVNPGNPQFPIADVAETTLESDTEIGIGWNIGLLHKATERFSWGFSYRSRVTVDYGGKANFTQISTGNDQVDDLIAGTLPFGEEPAIETSIEFPDMASLGLAYRISSKFLVEFDLNWVGWSSFDTTDIVFTSAPEFSSSIVSDWEDSNNYRAGLLWDVRGPGEWRFGAYFDETPQPDASVGPLLPDADRVGISAGYGRPLGKKTYLDLSVMKIEFDERTTTTNHDVFYGTYKTSVWLAGASIGW
jgi:long-chain fatty acid transport protein